ncbi:peptidyl-prolyl cis-trans isomerase [Rubellicoccus peritrichatus]|uniref:Peptidyl-prolyl cis-trans isomerase n=1 Tax=Rubellicoccus peritrichatus TaxID=3080537 RepID=A0AAQ3LCS1_9BACT|nr:peptidyl-prolyl cis-trans isomerase [Puniceicoccus sp. CR14]WOO42082.1 peptidyl-prolyl cis-trans isomerase [Puniceicoccus sp. CR14]
MFTWLQTVMQRHYKWLFSILLAVIIVAFVFTIGNTGGFGSGNPADVRREFYGINLNSPKDMNNLGQWTSISANLMQRRISPRNQEGAMLQRAVALYLADQMNIPGPGEQQFAEFLRDVPAFQDPQTKAFSRDLYTKAIDSAQSTPNGEENLSIVLIQDYRIQKVMDGLGGPGYVLPYMAMRELEQRNTKWTIDVASMDKAAFTPAVEATPEALQEFYEQNQFRYESGPKIVVSYVEFPAADFVGEVKDPTEADLTTYYNSNRTKWPKDEEGKTKPLADIRDEVASAWKLEQAEDIATAKANELAVVVFEATDSGELTYNPESIAAFLKKQGLTEKVLQAFPRNNISALVSTNTPFINNSAATLAASLNERRFYTDAVPSDDGATVLFLKEELPTTVPPLEDVRIQVAADYSKEEGERQFNLKAVELKKELTAALDEGKSFKEAAETAGLTVSNYADFTMMSPPQGLDYFVLSTLQNMDQGELSDMQSFSDLSTFVYVETKTVPEYPLDAPEVVENIEQLASMSSRLTAQGIINDLITIGEANARPEEF